MKYFSFCFFLLLCGDPAPAAAQDPDIEADERSALESVYRSSDGEGETPVSAGQRRRKGDKRVSVPRGAFRIGCICMDESVSPAHSIGACSGHGGVRYWLYRTQEGDTVRILTGRHERHPQPLDSAERSEIAQKRIERPKKQSGAANSLSPVAYGPPVVVMPSPEPAGVFGWGEVLAVAVAGVALYIIVRMLLRWTNTNQTLVRYALRHLLRSRKRPPARKSRKTARKTRV